MEMGAKKCIKMYIPLYRIVWSEPNGTSGNGEYCLELEAAISWLSYLRKEYPTMTHSLEQEPRRPSSFPSSVSEEQGQGQGQPPLVG
jgi:hypothetical protein